MAFESEKVRQILLDNNKLIDDNQSLLKESLKKAESKLNENITHLAELESLQRALRLGNMQIRHALNNIAERIEANQRQMQINNLKLLLEILSTTQRDVVPSC